MSNALIARAFYLSCELSKQGLIMPPGLSTLKSWGQVIAAGAECGLGGSANKLPQVSFDQLAALYESGIESGSEGGIQEFRSIMAGLISAKLCDNEAMSSIDKLELNAKLWQWYKGVNGQVGDAALDWDTEIEVPPFTLTGWFPIDKAHGDNGIAQGVSTVLSRPGVGKSTASLAIAKHWRMQDIGSVVRIETENAPAMVMHKINGMNMKHLFRKGEDKLIFGVRSAEQALQDIAENPDPDRLVLFDSVTGYSGQGDTPSSRERFSHLYTMLVQAANASRLLVAFTHVKRGVDVADLESAAGSSAIERFSRGMVYLSSDGERGPTGLVEVKARCLKNNYAPVVRPFVFDFNYTTGDAYPSTRDLDDEGESF